MATLYEILGVAPTASRSEIRAGYLKRARRHHPDQYADQPEEQQRAERRMQRINQAWETLNDPTRREAYDLTLRTPPSAPRATASRPPQQSPPYRPPQQPAYDPYDIDPASIDEGPVGFGTWVLRLVPLFLLLGVLGFILVVTAFAGGDSEPLSRTPTPTQPSDEGILRIGDCIVIAGGREVPCDAPNDGQIEAFVTLGAACPSAIARSFRPEGTDVLICVVPA